MLQNFSAHSKEPMSLQKASERAQSHISVSHDKCGSLGDVGVIVKHAVCDFAVMLVYSNCVGIEAKTSGDPSDS
jgi:hypothetical protein